jgi:ubiquitin C-terminal hydrolase
MVVAHSGSGYSGVSSAITQPVGFVTSSSLIPSIKGIENLGNTCYLAVAVQVLIFVFVVVLIIILK